MGGYLREITSGGCPHGRQENDISTYARLAAGLCVLSVVLVFGGFGGTTAVADTETDGAVSDAHGLSDADQAEHEVGSTPTESGETTVSPVVVDTVPTLVGTFDTSTLFGSDEEETSHEQTSRVNEEESSGLTGPMALGVTIGSESGTETPATGTVNDSDKGSDTVPADATQEVNEPDTVVSHSPTTEPSPPDATTVNADPPTATPTAEEPPAVQPLTNDVAVVDNSSARTEPAPLVVGPAAVGNLVAVLAYLFTPAPDGVAPILSLPSSLLSLLGFSLPGGIQSAAVAAGGIGGSLFAGAMSTAERVVLASSLSAQHNYWPEMLIASGGSPTWSAPGVGPQKALEGISAAGVKEEHLSMTLADSIVPEQVRSVLRHTVGAILAPLSLLVLALTASPGIAGLVLLGAAGTFFGYRQAKAASVLRAVGIARFVKAGPLGVVRSGGLVSVHSRTSRAQRGQSRRSAAKLESVA